MWLLVFWRLLQVHFCAAINKQMKYRLSQPTWRTGSFYSKLEALCLHTASQGIGTCIFCGCWLGFFLFWFGFLISFSVKGITRFLAGRLKGSSQLMKDQKNMAVTHFPLFRTLIHKIIKLFNHKIKSLGSIPCSDKIKSEHHLTVNTLINLFSGPWNFIFFNCHSFFNFIFYTAIASLYRMETSLSWCFNSIFKM